MDLDLELTGGLLRDDSQRAGFVALAAFLVTFLFIRTSARLMRDPRVTWWPGSVKTSGGLHIHHLVFGLGLVLPAGFLTILLMPESPLREVLAALFGIGAGLMLDEFALLLYLRDVYWAEEGRTSIDAVVLVTVASALAVLGAAPLDLRDATGSVITIAVVGLLEATVAAIALLKGKFVLGLAGVFVPLLAIVGATRLARPHSPWARWRYEGNTAKLARARAREERLERRRRAWSTARRPPSTSLARDG